MKAYVEGIGVLGPGFDNWPAARAILLGNRPYAYRPAVLAAPAALAAAERRRVGDSVKLALAVGYEAVLASKRDPSTLATVFSSSSGDGLNCHMICESLAGDRLVSPTRFANSVHNAPSGYWAIAHRAMVASTSLCGFDGSFGGGLLEAMAQVQAERSAVALIAYDTPHVEPLLSTRPGADSVGISLVLSIAETPNSLARVDLAWTTKAATELGVDAETRAAQFESPLEALRRAIPSARGLPLLLALARAVEERSAQRVVIEYLNGRQIALDVRACHLDP